MLFSNTVLTFFFPFFLLGEVELRLLAVFPELYREHRLYWGDNLVFRLNRSRLNGGVYFRLCSESFNLLFKFGSKKGNCFPGASYANPGYRVNRSELF
ncbi:hypothetical protein TNCT_65781 [Trichonephila clavata]|uniref:Secreted protein n=1 Tax=Trichonephila clavata TaxID=2740835 RepID=A0A8X6J1D3_TRICU|nr:hypothetical protein TNCT_229901 [Trichonephila clavata]GFR05678.1 hypothetical protein TNCT_65781 [Trichonephila clavata]